MITRRSILWGLFAAPAVVAIESLMPIRGIVQPVIMPLIGHVWYGLDGSYFTQWSDGALTIGRDLPAGVMLRADEEAWEFIRNHS